MKLRISFHISECVYRFDAFSERGFSSRVKERLPFLSQMSAYKSSCHPTVPVVQIQHGYISIADTEILRNVKRHLIGCR